MTNSKRNKKAVNIRRASSSLTEKQRLDPYLLFYQGRQFMIASEFLYSQNKMRIFGIPGTVASAFSSENFLKCLMVIAGKDPRDNPTHELDSLFEQIDEQSRVIRLWEASWKTFVDSEEGGNLRDLPAPNLHACLQRSGDAFDVFRYIYEKNGTLASEVGALPRVLSSAILEIRPEWDARFDADVVAARDEDLSMFKPQGV